ncbi:MAG: hypothetical protein CNLJKLNK_00797 [Holosporales bacterium]
MRKIEAFSLLELSIVLLCVGIVGVYALPALQNLKRFYHVAAIRKNQELIVKSLAYYADMHHCIPYASLPQAKGWKILNQTYGIVPYKTLGLEENQVKDSKGNWMIYALNAPLAQVCKNEQVEGKTIRDVSLAGSSLTIDDVKNDAADGVAFVLYAKVDDKIIPFDATEKTHFDSKEPVLFWISRHNFIAQYMKYPPPPKNYGGDQLVQQSLDFEKSKEGAENLYYPWDDH